MILIDPGQQEFIAGRGHDRRRHGPQRPGALPALPAPRLQAQPVPQELLVRVPVPRLALRPARDQGRRRRSTARRRAAWTASRSPSTTPGVLTINTGKITLGPLPVALGQPGLIPPRTPDRLHLIDRSADRPPRSPMTDTPGREPEQRLPAPTAAGRARAGRAVHARRRRPAASSSPRSAPAQIVRQSSNARWVGFLRSSSSSLFVVVYWFYELGAPLGPDRAAPRRRGRRPAGHRGRARLQHLRGELRALPRRQRRGRHRPGPQRPGQAVPAPQRDYLNNVLSPAAATSAATRTR